MSAPLVAIHDVSKTFGGRGGRARHAVRAADAVSLVVERGEALGIVGESGSGKSTLARMVMGLERADAGRVEVDGLDVGKLGRRERRRLARRVQMVFQDPYTSLNPHMTVGHAITEPALVAGLIERSQREAEARAALEAVGLRPEHAQVKPAALSGGQRQRVAIARALSLRPELLVADEAVSALDVSMQAQILNLLRRLREERELTILFISHQLGAIAQLCGRVAVMHRGRVVEQGTVEQVFEQPQEAYTRELLDAQPGRGTRLA